MGNAVLSFIRIPFKEKLLFFRALLIAYWVKFLLIFQSFKSLSLKYGSISKSTPYSEERLREIRRSIKRVSKVSLWKNKCLTNTLTARILLNKSSIPSEAFLGMRKKVNDEIAAHAWLEVNGILITAKEEEYTEVHQF